MPRAASSPVGPNPRPCALRLQKQNRAPSSTPFSDRRRDDQRRQGQWPASSTPASLRAHSALPSHRRSVIDRQLAPNIAWLGRPARANPHPFALPAVACAAASGFALARLPIRHAPDRCAINNPAPKGTHYEKTHAASPRNGAGKSAGHHHGPGDAGHSHRGAGRKTQLRRDGAKAPFFASLHPQRATARRHRQRQASSSPPACPPPAAVDKLQPAGPPPMPHRFPGAWGWIHPSPTAPGSATRWPWSMRGRPHDSLRTDPELYGWVIDGRRCRLRSKLGDSTSPTRGNQPLIPAHPSITHPCMRGGAARPPLVHRGASQVDGTTRSASAVGRPRRQAGAGLQSEGPALPSPLRAPHRSRAVWGG